MDSSRYKINKMLFIKNVSLGDCVSIDDMFEEKIMNQANDCLPQKNCTCNCNQKKNKESSRKDTTATWQQFWDADSKIHHYEKLPYIYTGMQSWLKKTNLHCWYCGLVFDDIPIFIPKSVEPNNAHHLQIDNQLHLLSEHSANILAKEISNNHESKYAMNREGCFCSFHCALSYIDLHYPKPHENIDKKGMLEILFHEMYRIHPHKLYKAPSKYDMIQYGGTLTPNEFKKKIQELQDESGITAIMRIKCKETSFKNQ